MKKETAIKRLLKSDLVTQKGELKKYYVAALMDICRYPTARHQLMWWRGKGSSLQDWSARYMDVLRALRIPYVWGNDAPRGGKEGIYIEVTKSGARAIKEYAEYVRSFDRDEDYCNYSQLLVKL